MASNVVYIVYETAEHPYWIKISMVSQKVYHVALGVSLTLPLYLPPTFNHARKWVFGYGLHW